MNAAIDLNTFKLGRGTHQFLEDGACIMEMVSYLANEPWSDHPKCACPVLTGYAIRLNDHFNDDHRQLMKKFIPLLINTKSTDEIQIARKRLIRWRNVTVTYPLILDSLKLPEIANELRTFSNTLTGMEKAKEFLNASEEKIFSTYSAVDPIANTYFDVDTIASTYVYAIANTYFDAYTYANTYTYTYTNFDADALREKIVEVSLETLRLAIEIREER